MRKTHLAFLWIERLRCWRFVGASEDLRTACDLVDVDPGDLVEGDGLDVGLAGFQGLTSSLQSRGRSTVYVAAVVC